MVEDRVRAPFVGVLEEGQVDEAGAVFEADEGDALPGRDRRGLGGRSDPGDEGPAVRGCIARRCLALVAPISRSSRWWSSVVKALARDAMEQEAVTAGERGPRGTGGAPDGPCSPRDLGGASGGGAELPGQGLLVDLADGGERQAGQEMDPVRDQMVLAELGPYVGAKALLVERPVGRGDGGVDAVAVDLGVGDGADRCGPHFGAGEQGLLDDPGVDMGAGRMMGVSSFTRPSRVR